MPKDEIDPDDPMELIGVGFCAKTDTIGPMTDCFIEEFMRLGYNHKQLLALFRNPHYLAMHMVLENKGEQFVRDRISEIFGRWGRPIVWAAGPASTPHSTLPRAADKKACADPSGPCGCGKGRCDKKAL